MAFSFTALNEGQWRPQSLRVEWGNTIRQRTKDRYFYTHEEANLGIQWGRLNISLAGGGSALFRDFDSSLEGLPDSLGTMINALTTNYQSLQLTPKLEYKRKRWEENWKPHSNITIILSPMQRQTNMFICSPLLPIFVGTPRRSFTSSSAPGCPPIHAIFIHFTTVL